MVAEFGVHVYETQLITLIEFRLNCQKNEYRNWSSDYVRHIEIASKFGNQETSCLINGYIPVSLIHILMNNQQIPGLFFNGSFSFSSTNQKVCFI